MQAEHEHLLDRACCPRCGGDVKKVKTFHDDNYDAYGFRVRHADSESACGRIEWAIFDPAFLDSETGAPGSPDAQGVSICRTCYSTVQHFDVRTPDDGDEREVVLEDPPRDEAGQIICSLCDHRMRKPKDDDAPN